MHVGLTLDVGCVCHHRSLSHYGTHTLYVAYNYLWQLKI